MRYFLALMFGLMITSAATHPARAHSKIAKSDPLEGATIAAGRAHITLGFTKSVRIMVVKVHNETTKTDVPTDLAPQQAYLTTLTVKVAPLKPGAYAVPWTAVAKDGHVMKGTLRFSVKE